MRKNITCFLILLALACSCTKESGLSRIRVRVSTSGTKVSEMTTKMFNNLGNFVLNAYVDEDYDYNGYPEDSNYPAGSAGAYLTPTDQYTANVHLMSGSWTIDNNKVWIADTKTRFYCHAPANVDGTGEGLNFASDAYKWNSAGHEDETAFSYTMTTAGQTDASGNASDADHCTDLLFAYAEKVFDGTSETVDLTFLHALSKVTFAVSPDDDSFDKTLKIKTISISGVSKSGNCTFEGGASTFSWSNLGETATYTQYYNASFATKPDGWTAGSYTKDSKTHTIYSADNSFFFIPETLSGAKVTIVFVDNGTEVTREVTLDNDTWEAGKYYKYKITATLIGRYINTTVTLDEWINYDDKLII